MNTSTGIVSHLSPEDLENNIAKLGKANIHQHIPLLPDKHSLQTSAIVACLLYSVCSMLMTFSNKIVLSSFEFKWPMLLMAYQHVFTVIFVQVAQAFGFITVEPLQWKLVKKWLPCNILFVAMLLSGSYALKFLSVPMLTIFKNFTTMIITGGDYFIFGQPVSNGVNASLLLMLFGSVVAAFYDLSFNRDGYLWMSFNCVVSAGYVLYMRTAMKGTKLSEFGNVYYNNILSIPLVLPLMFMNGLDGVTSYPYWSDGQFIAMAFFGGLSSVGISFASFWTVRTTSPTTYSIVGALNKIPLTILGVLFFKTPINFLGGVSIVIGLAGGVVYSLCKHLEWASKNPNKATE